MKLKKIIERQLDKISDNVIYKSLLSKLCCGTDRFIGTFQKLPERNLR